MSNYRRNRVSGGTYFFSVNLLECKTHLPSAHIDKLRHTVRIVREKHPFSLILGSFCPITCTLSGRYRPETIDIRIVGARSKQPFLKRLPTPNIALGTGLSEANGEYGKGDFGSAQFSTKRIMLPIWNYIHYNPVNHGWVLR